MVRTDTRVSEVKFEGIFIRPEQGRGERQMTIDVFVLPMAYLGMDHHVVVPVDIMP